MSWSKEGGKGVILVLSSTVGGTDAVGGAESLNRLNRRTKDQVLPPEPPQEEEGGCP